MNAAGVSLVRESWACLAGREERLAAVFYERLFHLAPELRDLFVLSDMVTLRGKLAWSLAMVVGSLDDPERWSAQVGASARRHALYGVGASAYRIGGEALLWALAHELGPRFTPDVQVAWAEAYTATVDRMLRAARAQDAATGAPAR